MTSRLGLLFVTAVLAIATPATADDGKAYHGSMCKLDIDGSTTETLIYLSGGLKCTSDECHVACPFVRDRISDADNIQDVNVEVYNNDASSLGCTFYTMNEDASSGVVVDSESQSTVLTGNRQLSYAALDSNTGGEGSYFMTCFMEDNDFIRQTSITEDTDLGGTD